MALPEFRHTERDKVADGGEDKDTAGFGEKEAGVYEFAIEPAVGADIRRELFTRLASRGWALMGLRSMEMTLEDIFITLTRERLPQTAAVKKGRNEK